jgi:hypothetical protein
MKDSTTRFFFPKLPWAMARERITLRTVLGRAHKSSPAMF